MAVAGDGAGDIAAAGVAAAAERRLQAFENEIARDDDYLQHAAAAAATTVRGPNKRERADRADRATSEQVLDPRTRMVLFKLLASGVLEDLSGCISTGKEANVYSGSGKGGVPVAVKVFKTAILVFKDRQQYIEGDFRFKQGYHRGKNARKMVQVWAEKEYRNLSRIQEAGITSPVPIFLRSPVLVMSFCGHDGWPAPRLKEVAAQMTPAMLERVYSDVVLQMWKMYKRARLVHGDLSEYNILMWVDQVVIIDVSQSVEHDHPHALEFLRRDCANVNAFFRRHGVPTTLTLKELFDFITRRAPLQKDNGKLAPPVASISGQPSDEDDTAVLESMIVLFEFAREHQDRTNDVDEEVFRQAFIPRDLHEVADYEKDADLMANGHADELFYRQMRGLTTVASSSTGSSTESDNDSELHSHASDESEGSGHDSERSWEVREKKDSRCGLSKQEWKKKVKADNREKRENKIPKKEKKRRAALARRRKVGSK